MKIPRVSYIYLREFISLARRVINRARNRAAIETQFIYKMYK